MMTTMIIVVVLVIVDIIVTYSYLDSENRLCVLSRCLKTTRAFYPSGTVTTTTTTTMIVISIIIVSIYTAHFFHRKVLGELTMLTMTGCSVQIECHVTIYVKDGEKNRRNVFKGEIHQR